jgi:hypothetical protein
MERVLSRMNIMREEIAKIKKSKISEKDVSLSTMKKKDIASILHKIKVFEDEFEEHKTKEYGQDLLALYQKAIEYYSALGQLEYKEYLDRMTVLL